MFVKGKSGNPKGRPREGESNLQALEKAIAKVCRGKRIKWWEHVVVRALENDKVLVALVSKLVPNLEKHQIDAVVNTHEDSLDELE